jgi:hypothetical protein
MILNFNDSQSRNIALALIDPVSGLAYNRTTDALEPFDPTKHLSPAKASPIAPVASPATPAATFSGARYVDVGGILSARPNLAIYWIVVDGAGLPITMADCWPNPYAVPASLQGGWVR